MVVLQVWDVGFLVHAAALRYAATRSEIMVYRDTLRIFASWRRCERQIYGSRGGATVRCETRRK